MKDRRERASESDSSPRKLHLSAHQIAAAVMETAKESLRRRRRRRRSWSIQCSDQFNLYQQ